MKFTVYQTPKAKQSARFRIGKLKSGKNFVMSYKDSKVKAKEKSIAEEVAEQLPEGFKLIDQPMKMIVNFVTAYPKSWSKKKVEETYYKTSRSDLDNNLKLLGDSLEGVLFENDSYIVDLEAKKTYGEVSKIEFEIIILN